MQDEYDHVDSALGPFAPSKTVPADFARKLERERDEARETLADWENAAAHVEADHPDETHCGCVSVLRKLLHDARSERDEARAQRDRLAEELIARWDQPSWKDTAPTARYINALRIAVRAYEDATRALGDVKHDPLT